MEFVYDRITLYHKNGKVVYAKIEYRKNYGQNRVVELEKNVKANELNAELGRIIHYYRENGYKDFDIRSLFAFRDYVEGKNIKDKNILSHIDSVDNKNFDMMKRVKKKLGQKNINIKKLGSLSLACMLALAGTGYSIATRLKPKMSPMEKSNKVIEYMQNSPENVSLGDIDDLLSRLDNTDSEDKEVARNNLELCKKIYNSYKTEYPFLQTVINRFNKMNGLSSLDLMNDNMVNHLCVYGTNLVMGGDNYGHLYNSNSSIFIATNLDELTGKDYYDYVSMIAKEYNISEERVQCAALYSESLMYENLPPMIKYIIICQTENAVRKKHFEFQDKALIPTWWVSLNDKYDYDKLINDLELKKEECKKAIYAIYGNEDANEKGKR